MSAGTLPARRLVLKIDVDTYRGTLEGVPALLGLLQEFGVSATFLFSLGPDHTGRALRRVFKRGFLTKVRRTSVTRHYGVRTLLYGVLLPGPDIAEKAGHVMRAAQQAGHELGTHAYDHVRWQDQVARRDAAWTAREMARAQQAFQRVLGTMPATTGAAGWQINRHVLTLEDSMGYRYASDVRGHAPFLPSMDDIRARCVQLPTTLPTLDELLAEQGAMEDALASRLLDITAAQPGLHVYTLHAELEGMKLMHVFRDLLRGWQQQGYRLGTLGDAYRSLDLKRLPRHGIEWHALAGRAGVLACEGQPQ